MYFTSHKETPLKLLLTLLTAAILGACSSSTWIKQDGERIDNKYIDVALNRCDFEKRRKAALLYITNLDSNSADTESDEEAENLEQLHPQIDQETLNCMIRKGFKRHP